MFRHVADIQFPEFRGSMVNMMPIISGDPDSVPAFLKGYLPLIEKANFEKGKTAYLTVTESLVKPGETQRRPGLHTDGTAIFNWGGGGWGGGAPAPTPAPAPAPAPKPPEKKGIFMASSDGRCRVFDCFTYDVDGQGSLLKEPEAPSFLMKPSGLYWMTDRTPHESLPSLQHHSRQFYRLVSDEVGIWWARHSTANPLGVQPNCRVEYGSKFA